MDYSFIFFICFQTIFFLFVYLGKNANMFFSGFLLWFLFIIIISFYYWSLCLNIGQRKITEKNPSSALNFLNLCNNRSERINIKKQKDELPAEDLHENDSILSKIQKHETDNFAACKNIRETIKCEYLKPWKKIRV